MSRMAEEQIAWTALRTGETDLTSGGATHGKGGEGPGRARAGR